MSEDKICNYCYGHGYTQVYRTIVLRTYCDCEAGQRAINRGKDALREVGLDPDKPEYRWQTRKDILNMELK